MKKNILIVCGVNNLSSKIAMTLLPPNAPFFRWVGDTIKLKIQAEEQGEDPDKYEQDFNKNLSHLTEYVKDSIEEAGDRVVVGEGIKHLIIGGNCLFVDKPKDNLVYYAMNRYVVRRDYLVVKQDCEFVFLDHISALGSGIKAGNDVNQTMKNISSELASLTRELGFTLFAVSHLRKSTGKKDWEDGEIPTLGDFEGSSDIVKWANFVFTLSRNKNAKGDRKHLSKLHCLKDRYTGKADGLVIVLKYDGDDCQMIETICTEEFTNEETNEYDNYEEQEEF